MPHRRKVVVFLGAGASVPLGYPHTTQVVNEFVTELQGRRQRNRRELRRLRQIKRTLEEDGIQFDAESLYTCLQGLVDPVSYLREAGPFPVLMSRIQPITSIRTDEITVSLRRKFERFMLSKYYLLTPAMRVRILQAYNRMFSRISGVRNWRNQTPNWQNTVFEIFTTNYDLSVETYAEMMEVDMMRGFRADVDGNVIFTPEEYKTGLAQIRLYKLHGSIDLSELENRRVKLDRTHYPGEGNGELRVKRKIMVYGITKDLTAEPYFDLLGIMKKTLKKNRKCFVVGYSFRDQWIRNIFSDVIRNDPESKEIVYIDPSPNEKLEAFPFLRGVTRPVPNHLEEYLDLPSEGH